MAEIVALKPEVHEGPVTSSFADGILRITLANPPANALSLATMAAMQDELARARDDRAVMVIIIAAAGKLFSGVPSEYLTQVTNKYAQTIASKSPLTLKLGKEAFYAQAGMGLADAYGHATRVMVENMLTHDAEEGIDAFIGKRKPEWKGE